MGKSYSLFYSKWPIVRIEASRNDMLSTVLWNSCGNEIRHIEHKMFAKRNSLSVKINQVHSPSIRYSQLQHQCSYPLIPLVLTRCILASCLRTQSNLVPNKSTSGYHKTVRLWVVLEDTRRKFHHSAAAFQRKRLLRVLDRESFSSWWDTRNDEQPDVVCAILKRRFIRKMLKLLGRLSVFLVRGRLSSANWAIQESKGKYDEDWGQTFPLRRFIKSQTHVE